VFTLLFFTGTADLTPESEAKLPDILAAIRERDSKDISIIGHSDRRGSDELNHKISLERARAVHRILAERGVPETIIETQSHGEGNPRVPTADGVSEPRNRRVEVTVR
jgi:outer membrane protein OmpA-like peptidoglycan-associated protein